MMKWSFSTKLPLLIPFASYLIGILLSHYSGFILDIKQSFFLLLGICLLLLLGNSIYLPFSHRYYFGLLTALAFTMLGFLNYQYASSSNLTSTSTEKTHLLRIVEPPLEKNKTYAVKANQINSNTAIALATVRLYLQKDDRAALLQPGNLILVKKSFYQEKTLLNPGEFDFNRYLNTKGIHAQVYVNKNQWRLYQKDVIDNLSLKSWETRQHLASTINSWHASEPTKALAMALLLGDREAMDKEKLKTYAGAGAMHVLAVSGLHTGIFYLLLNLLFRPLHRIRHGKEISTLMIVIVLWAYAMVTGLSASVVRAVCMFSLIAVGSGIQRKTNVYNTVLASAMLLLLFQPLFLFQLGFQLSYAAVLGIISLFPLLRKAFQPRYSITQKIWDIVCVSIAAQIATLPIALYYFHQFPVLFIFTNLLVIPLVTVIMYVGILCLSLSSFGWNFGLGIQVLDLLVGLMDGGVALIESTETSIRDIVLQPLTVILLYLLILQLLRWWIKGRFSNLRATAILCGILMIISVKSQIDKNHPVLIVYHLADDFAIGAFGANEALCLADSAVLVDSIIVEHRVKPHWMRQGNTDPELLTPDDGYKGRMISKQGSFLSLHREIYLLVTSDPLPQVDIGTWIVITDVPPPQKISPSVARIVLTQNVSSQHVKEWLKHAGNIEVWNVETQGPWISS